MNILFFSTHGSLTAELAIFCQYTRHKMFLATIECGIGSCTPKEEAKEYAQWGVTPVSSYEELMDSLRTMDAIFVVTPEQHVQVNDFGVPIYVIAGIPGGAADKFNAIKADNIMSPSAKHLSLLSARNKLLYPRMVPWDRLPRRLQCEEKKGFYSYVHWLEKYWPNATAKIETLNKSLSVHNKRVMNFGHESKNGIVNDLASMNGSKATLHIKDRGLTCFAAIRSMAIGTPVIMDRASYDGCFFDNINGIIIKNDINEIADEIVRLDEDDDYLEAACDAAYCMAKSQFAFGDKEADAFGKFMTRQY